MAGIRFSELTDRFAANLERLSATVIRDRTRDDTRPARMRVLTSGGASDCLLFLWAVTHGGGRMRPEDERRIQLTNVAGIPLRPGQRTVLGGWSEEFGVWVFWDARRHVRFSSKSPSLQVGSMCLEQAGRVGLATYLRKSATGLEVVAAVAPDSLLWYVHEGHQLHNAEDDAAAVDMLVEATAEEEREFLDETASEVITARRYDLVETVRAYRDAKFRPAVLRAYSYRCAVCQCALKLVDAAHIIPVADPQSTDDITNGIALCRLHHGAFDNGLLGVQSNYCVVVNSDHQRHLTQLGLDTGIDRFRDGLPAKITVPASIEVRPDPRKLLLGLRCRQWPDTFIA
ncbi:MAG: HNH endonuclease [Pirellulales bacterium]